jgi:membrane glycosyltransferase
MAKEKQIREVIVWFFVGFIVAALSVIPTPINDLSVAGYVSGFFLGFIVPLASIRQEVKDLLMSKWSGVCGLTYAVGLLWGSSALLSSGASFWTLALPILEGVVCLIVSVISIIVQLVEEISS